ncbi:MAG TPA: thiamine phosphate synthase [Myxococcota bacterium]|nr:thiamine phosphate synthase [Myxococcota bacterium]
MTDRASACGAKLPEIAAAAVRGGADWVQVREKDLDGAALLALVREIQRAVRAQNPAARVIVNRRIDVALAADAEGAHLGFDALPLSEARELLGSAALIGVSTHAAAEVLAAAHAGASYAHLAPIFAPYSKAASRAPLGLAALSEAARAGLPVIAQGGIDAQRAGACIRAGAAGVAVTGELCSAPDPERAARALRAALDGAA